MNKKTLIWLPVIIAIAIISGIYIGRYYHTVSTVGSGFFSPKSKIDALIDIINKQYVDTVDTKQMIEDIMPKVIGELDPHSAYISAKDLESINEELEGSFGGIGIQFSILEDTITVVSVISGGPAEKVGIIPGDRIIAVNDTAFVGEKVTNEKVMSKLRGPKNSDVNLTIKRVTAKKPLDFTLTRGDIPLNSLDASFKINDKTGYLKIRNFGRTTYDEFMNALAKLRKDGAEKFIIDLRGNTGGYMEAAINMVTEFLPKGQLIVYTEGKSYPRNEAYSNGTGAFQKNQMIVLMDEWSASASEIFAGAIQDNDRGLIVGRRSFGKGLVQQQIPFSDGSAIRLTVARYFTPSGRSIQKEYKMGDGEDYSKDLMIRFLHGEFDSKDSIKQNTDLVYKTLNGRTVYGGGGIMPDIFVPRDTIGITSYLNNVVNSGLIYQYAFKYADENREKLESFKDYKDLLRHLQKQPLLNDFVRYATSKGVKPRPVYINISRHIINNQLQAYIARNILGDEAFYPVLLTHDNTLLKAVELLNDNKGFPEIPVN
ncbi:S41 family peptidase [Coprobacter tertius]|uniref:S41 family peptidase n=1 Tax=Coprobacter tertius TaxID=2944915 RepID=A0ABT1MFE2_9BACT|nr:S41 family peptidase [Coprobacter tertius]MCP9611069.1 S41 family peptidase [Coprobacter tertius]